MQRPCPQLLTSGAFALTEPVDHLAAQLHVHLVEMPPPLAKPAHAAHSPNFMRGSDGMSYIPKNREMERLRRSADRGSDWTKSVPLYIFASTLLGLALEFGLSFM